MNEPKHTIDDLRQMQALPLNLKIRLTEDRIRGWLDQYDAYVSFSGGKDSTVLLYICRKIDPNIPAVFVDTGLEYPEIRNFVKTFDNVAWLKPKMNFKKVIEKYGYPFIGKEVSECVYGARKYLKKIKEKIDEEKIDEEKVPYEYAFKKITNKSLLQIGKEIAEKNSSDLNYRSAQLLDVAVKYWGEFKKGELQEEKLEKNPFTHERYAFFLDAPFEISSMCCNVMKKNPVHKYAKETGRMPITAQMAEESRLRMQKWLQNGCNGFNLKSPISNPMSFWTEQDVLQYIKEKNIKIASVYGDVVVDHDKVGELDGQISFADFDSMKMMGIEKQPLKTTGCKRTGCMFCGFGCHLENESRFVRLKETHPAQYKFIMKPWDEGGLGYKEVIDWINEHGDLNIKY